MITHCAKCDINWARLLTLNSEVGDESYDVCPKCKSDMDLGPATDIDGHIMCPITNIITNVETGKRLEFKYTGRMPQIKTRNRKPPDPDRHVKREERELNAILAYQDAYRSHGSTAAQSVYFQTISKP